MDMERVREAARSAARELGYTDLKQEQLRVVEAFVEGVMCSLCCQLAMEKACRPCVTRVYP